MEDTTLPEFQNLMPMTIPNYYKMMRFDQFLRKTIAIGKTNKQAAELLDVSRSTIIDTIQQWVLHQNGSQLIEHQKRNRLRCLSL